MLLKMNRLSGRSAVAAALLALLVVSTLALPVRAIAEDSAPNQPVANQTATLGQAGGLAAASLPSPLLARPDAPVTLNGVTPLLFTAAAPAGLPAPDFRQSSRERSLFNPGPLFDQDTQESEAKQGVRKKYLVLGILGIVTAAGGVVAVTQSNKYCTTNNISGNGGAQQICNTAHTAGEVMIPVGLASAGLWFWLAFRHRH